jgi:xylulokinase
MFLGFDSSTQSLTAIVIDVDGDDRASLVWESQLNFEKDLPEFGTRHGVLPNDDPRVAEAPPAMWVAALEMMFGRLAASGLDLSRIAAISGSAQQHGTVYLDANGRFTRAASPIWMDASTSVECTEITDALGGDAAAAALTGSRVFERFAGPQIRRFWKRDPEAYARTHRIHLISSFLCSQLLGRDAAIDPGDGSGMSLMSLGERRWSARALAATAPDLADKLPAIAPSDAVLGTLAPRWQARYGLPAARIVTWTGDNSSSLVGTGVVEEGALAISLGTSDTIFGVMTAPRVSANGEGHVFGAPTGDYMGITVFANGSLAREHIRDTFGMDWAAFSRALRSRPPGNGGAMLIPWFGPEITPQVTDAQPVRYRIAEDDAAGNVRGVVEGQMMAMANHSAWMGVSPKTIYATGGASGNPDVLQVMADVFDATVYKSPVTNSACLGSALRAWHADRAAIGRPIAWRDVVRDLCTPRPSTATRVRIREALLYRSLRRDYRDLVNSRLAENSY